MDRNPYTLVFGKEPAQAISRASQSVEIMENFCREEPYRQYLEDYVYEKIWAELSRGDRRVLFGIARSAAGKISEIRDILQMETNQFNPYRKRLIKRGIINGEVRGYVHFVLPLFEQFVLENYSEE